MRKILAVFVLTVALVMVAPHADARPRHHHYTGLFCGYNWWHLLGTELYVLVNGPHNCPPIGL